MICNVNIDSNPINFGVQRPINKPTMFNILPPIKADLIFVYVAVFYWFFKG